MKKEITILLLKNSFILLKKKNKKIIYIYNKMHYFFLYLPINFAIFFNKYCNSLTLIITNYNVNIKVIEKILNTLLFTWNSFLFKKIKFSGKGYKIKKSKKSKINFFFNRAHRCTLLLKKLNINKIRKTKFIIFFTKNKNILVWGEKICKIRNISPYTKKGIRSSRSSFLKKSSKKSGSSLN